MLIHPARGQVMNSYADLFATFGDLDYLDRIEAAGFNRLPVRPQGKAGFLVLRQCLCSLKRCLSSWYVGAISEWLDVAAGKQTSATIYHCLFLCVPLPFSALNAACK